ncbi:MAG: hypothetical protein C5B54_02830 [Acidobacteria bacterium]|nr:MAG: hypothetical protein C5B54_02830 [Acidobacteriota bacterium]
MPAYVYGKRADDHPASRIPHFASRIMIIVYPANTTLPSSRANTIQILHTVRELAAQGNEVHLIARKGNKSEQEIFEYYGLVSHQNLHLHLVSPRESIVLKETLVVLGQRRNEEKILFTRDHLFADLLLKMRRLMNFKLVYEAHTLFFITAKETYMPIAWNEKKEKRIQKRESRIFQRADGIVFITSSLKDFVREHFAVTQPSQVIHDGTMVPSYQSVEQKSAQLLCYSGQFYLWKGISTLLESLRWIDGARLLMFGGNYSTVHDDMREMQRIIVEHNLGEKVEFRGFVPPSQIQSEISKCNIGILPLPQNIIGNRCNSPLKLFDYMANGLAVVASDLLTVREIIHHGKNGHVVEPGNPKKLAEGINEVLTDASYRNRLTAAAFETVKEYSWQKRGEHLHQFLSNI